MIFVSRNIHLKAQMNLLDILMLGTRRVEFTDIKPTFEQYYRLLLGKLTVSTEYVLAPWSDDVK